MPFFTIVTINKDNSAGLFQTLNSVINQTFLDYEYIVIDGASSDGSSDVIERYSDKISFSLSEKDSGIYNAMNKGIERAKGEFILFLNSGDTLFSKTTLGKVASYIRNTPHFDIYFGDVFAKNRVLNPNMDVSFEMMCVFIPHQATFSRRKLFIQKRFDEGFRIAGDFDWLLSQYLNDVAFEKMDFCISYYDTNGISSLKNSDLLNEKLTVIEHNLEQMRIFDFDYINNPIIQLALRTSQFSTFRKKIIQMVLKLLVNGFEVFSFYQIKSYWKGKIK